MKSVHVGSTRVDAEALRWSVGGLHLVLPAAVQTAGIHHRYVLVKWLDQNFNHHLTEDERTVSEFRAVSSSVSPPSGVYAGIKFFIIDFILKSCPKLRQRFDTPYIIWTNLPTDLQLKERSHTTVSRRVSPHSHILYIRICSTQTTELVWVSPSSVSHFSSSVCVWLCTSQENIRKHTTSTAQDWSYCKVQFFSLVSHHAVVLRPLQRIRRTSALHLQPLIQN